MPSSYQQPDSLYLCIDQGGHASRAMVFSSVGLLVAEAHIHISAQHPKTDYVEYDSGELMKSVNQAIEAVIAELGAESHRIVAAGLATQRSNIVCWDKYSGQALSPIISWQDRRTHQWLQQFKPHADSIHRTTGLFLSAHYGASKLRWCLDHLPQVQQALAENRLCLGPMSSFITHHLVKERPFIVDPVNASRTQLWDLEEKNWNAELTSLFGIPENTLPRCVPSIYDYGYLQLNDHTIPLRLVSGDQAAAMYAHGQLQPDTAYINIGTGAFISRPSGYSRIYGRRLLTSVILQKNTQTEYVLEGTVNGAGSALEWINDELVLTDLTEQLPTWLKTQTSPPLFLNGISGLGAPFWVTDFQSQFIGEGSQKNKVVAVIESIIFLIQSSIHEMLKLSSPPEQIQISGGLSLLDGLCQRLANISDLPVYRPMDCEATTRGTAYLLAESPTSWPEEEPGVWFEPQYDKELNQRFVNWHDAMLKAMRKDKVINK